MAFYKSTEDLQKRHKQIYSPGMVIDTQASYTNEKGDITTVGKTYNNLYLQDNEITTSLNINVIKEGLEESVARDQITTNDMYSILAKYGYKYDSVLNKEYPDESQFIVIRDGVLANEVAVKLSDAKYAMLSEGKIKIGIFNLFAAASIIRILA